MEQYQIGQVIDFTRTGDDSPFLGVIVYDKDLEKKVCYKENGGFIYLDDDELKTAEIVEKQDVDKRLELVKINYPDDYTFTTNFVLNVINRNYGSKYSGEVSYDV